MRTNHHLSILILVLLSILYGCKSAPTKSNKKSPNFIIILADDQGWNGTSVQMMDEEIRSKSDYHQTPNLEALAKRGMRFSSAYASAPVCSPSRYSIQFGQTPARLKMIRVGMNTNHINHQTALTIPKLLKSIDPNYTAAHFGKWGIDVDPKVLAILNVKGLKGKNRVGLGKKTLKRINWVIPLQRILRKSLAPRKALLILLNLKQNLKRLFSYKCPIMQFIQTLWCEKKH